MINAGKKFKTISEEFNTITGRNHGSLTFNYRCDDAEFILIAMGTLFNQCIKTVNILREKGVKIGAIKIRAIRPFPKKDIMHISNTVKALLIFDRDLSLGVGGILAWEIKSALADTKTDVDVFSAVIGLGGRDIHVSDILEFVKEVKAVVETKKMKKEIYWIGLREAT